MENQNTMTQPLHSLMRELGFSQSKVTNASFGVYFAFKTNLRLVTNHEAYQIVLDRFPSLEISNQSATETVTFYSSKS